MSYLNTILNDDFVWDALTMHCVGKARPGAGICTLTLNCPMCVSRGETADRRARCGIIRSTSGFGVNCFNCGFRSRFAVGQRLSRSMEAFLAAIGVPARDLAKIRYHAHELSRMVEIATEKQPDFVLPQFPMETLPTGCKALETWADEECCDPDYLAVVDYLLNRGETAATAIRYYWTPDNHDKDFRRRLFIPMLHNDRLVGWSGRTIDQDTKKKYYNKMPQNFLFNSKFLTYPHRKYLFIVEGVFDALVIDGVAALGADLNTHQIGWINQSDKVPVVIPDRDRAGKRLVDVALKQQWSVSIPNYGARMWWDHAIKDVDEAVRRHGKLYTLRSIIENIVSDPVIISQRMSYYT